MVLVSASEVVERKRGWSENEAHLEVQVGVGVSRERERERKRSVGGGFGGSYGGFAQPVGGESEKAERECITALCGPLSHARQIAQGNRTYTPPGLTIAQPGAMIRLAALLTDFSIMRPGVQLADRSIRK